MQNTFHNLANSDCCLAAAVNDRAASVTAEAVFSGVGSEEAPASTTLPAGVPDAAGGCKEAGEARTPEQIDTKEEPRTTRKVRGPMSAQATPTGLEYESYCIPGSMRIEEHPLYDDAIQQVYDKIELEMMAEPDVRVRAEQVAKDAGEVLTPEQAAARVESWRQAALEEGRTSKNATKVVLSMFDESGVFAHPWRDAGYDVYQFDINPGDGPAWEVDILQLTAQFLLDNGIVDVDVLLAQPPCTDFACSGARWFAEKDSDGRTAASIKLVHMTCATIGFLRPLMWGLENPVGRIAKLTGLPQPRLLFQPHNYGDPYTKKTLIWGDFNPHLPQANVEPTEGSRMHKLRGDVPEQKKLRSLTPEGFAYAFWMANRDYRDRFRRRVRDEIKLIEPEQAGRGSGEDAESQHGLMPQSCSGSIPDFAIQTDPCEKARDITSPLTMEIARRTVRGDGHVSDGDGRTGSGPTVSNGSGVTFGPVSEQAGNFIDHVRGRNDAALFGHDKTVGPQTRLVQNSTAGREVVTARGDGHFVAHPTDTSLGARAVVHGSGRFECRITGSCYERKESLSGHGQVSVVAIHLATRKEKADQQHDLHRNSHKRRCCHAVRHEARKIRRPSKGSGHQRRRNCRRNRLRPLTANTPPISVVAECGGAGLLLDGGVAGSCGVAFVPVAELDAAYLAGCRKSGKNIRQGPFNPVRVISESECAQAGDRKPCCETRRAGENPAGDFEVSVCHNLLENTRGPRETVQRRKRPSDTRTEGVCEPTSKTLGDRVQAGIIADGSLGERGDHRPIQVVGEFSKGSGPLDPGSIPAGNILYETGSSGAGGVFGSVVKLVDTTAMDDRPVAGVRRHRDPWRLAGSSPAGAFMSLIPVRTGGRTRPGPLRAFGVDAIGVESVHALKATRRHDASDGPVSGPAAVKYRGGRPGDLAASKRAHSRQAGVAPGIASTPFTFSSGAAGRLDRVRPAGHFGVCGVESRHAARSVSAIASFPVGTLHSGTVREQGAPVARGHTPFFLAPRTRARRLSGGAPAWGVTHGREIIYHGSNNARRSPTEVRGQGDRCAERDSLPQRGLGGLGRPGEERGRVPLRVDHPEAERGGEKYSEKAQVGHCTSEFCPYNSSSNEDGPQELAAPTGLPSSTVDDHASIPNQPRRTPPARTRAAASILPVRRQS